VVWRRRPTFSCEAAPGTGGSFGPGGGISADRKRWIACRPRFFLPVCVLSARLRRLFLEHLQAAFDTGPLRFFSSVEHLRDTKQWRCGWKIKFCLSFARMLCCADVKLGEPSRGEWCRPRAGNLRPVDRLAQSPISVGCGRSKFASRISGRESFPPVLPSVENYVLSFSCLIE
jgi:hypothetical protein